MTSAMFRRCLTVALVAVVALAPAAPAQAGGGEKSRFAGTYDAYGVPVTISNVGQITGSSGTSNYYKVSISGRVSADASFSLTVTETYFEHGPRDHGRTKSTSESAGSMALDADGNIVGTPDSGGSFVWLRT